MPPLTATRGHRSILAWGWTAVRHYEFVSSVHLMSQVRAFLGSTAHRDHDYCHLSPLGNELAANALTRTRTGQPLSHRTLTCGRRRDSLHLTCQDQGDPGSSIPTNPTSSGPTLKA